MTFKPNKVGRMIDSDFEPKKLKKKCENCGENFRPFPMEGFKLLVCYCGVKTR